MEFSMRLTRYLNEEDIIKKGLGVPEPEVGEEYSKEEVQGYIAIVKDAISAVEEEEKEGSEAVIKDLQDKLNKWENVDSETEAAGPSVPAVDILAAQPPEGEEQAPPKKEK